MGAHGSFALTTRVAVLRSSLPVRSSQPCPHEAICDAFRAVAMPLARSERHGHRALRHVVEDAVPRQLGEPYDDVSAERRERPLRQ